MILIDTSAWIEFLRDTGSNVCARVDALLEADIATCHPVRMEVLAGARDDLHLANLRRLLDRCSLLSAEPIDFEQAAALFRICRRKGESVRALTDCLIAATAMRAGAVILHADHDYEVLSRHTPLRLDIPP